MHTLLNELNDTVYPHLMIFLSKLKKYKIKNQHKETTIRNKSLDSNEIYN